MEEDEEEEVEDDEGEEEDDGFSDDNRSDSSLSINAEEQAIMEEEEEEEENDNPKRPNLPLLEAAMILRERSRKRYIHTLRFPFESITQPVVTTMPAFPPLIESVHQGARPVASHVQFLFSTHWHDLLAKSNFDSPNPPTTLVDYIRFISSCFLRLE